PASARTGSPCAGLVGGDGDALGRGRRATRAVWVVRLSSGRRPGRAGLPEVIADELALLRQQLVEVLVDVRLADRLRGQVQILDLLELARAVVRRLRGRVARRRVCWRLARMCAVRDGGLGGIGARGGMAGRARRI